MTFIVAIGRDEATRAVEDVHRQLSSPEERRAFMKNIGVRAELELRAWFYKRDAENPNKMGWPRQHFWARIAKRTAFDPARTTENTATIVVSDPALGAKIDGATIKPTDSISPITGKPRRALAIPMNAEAYGVRPASGLIPGLFVLRLTSTNGAYLVKKEGTGPNANLTFYYKLVAQVVVPKDPAALPPAAALGAALVETAQAFYLRRQSGGPN